ncbi:MAG: aminopeptidase [Clostridiales bacterium]|nr:aminopeptidase [Clostridiales bacterium]
MNEKMLQQYARLVINVGVNIQKGQALNIACPVECAFFARLLVAEAYKAGAKDVIINWRDDVCSREHYLHADDSLFDAVYPWDVLLKNTLGREGAAFVGIAASDPENLKGVDPERLRRWEIAVGRDLKEYYRLQMSNGFPWCLVSIPIVSWARKVFPEQTDDEAMEKLWAAIFKAVRITENGDACSDGSAGLEGNAGSDGGAIREWREHCDRLKVRADKLNEYNFKSLHYTTAIGTDLTIEMPENHLWLAVDDAAKSGVNFVANMPSEEIFSAPLRDSAKGVLVTSKPLVLNGNIVDGIRLVFEKGKIVDLHAEVGEETLRASVEIDEGSHYLGEIALVPYDSPISSSGVLFYNTLFDENASCHFAFGEAYSSCIKGGTEMSVDELKASGINAESSTHVDFMVGTEDLSIVGTTHDGRQVPVFENGNFAF